MNLVYLIPIYGYFLFYGNEILFKKRLTQNYAEEFSQTLYGRRPVTLSELTFCFAYHITMVLLIFMCILYFNI